MRLSKMIKSRSDVIHKEKKRREIDVALEFPSSINTFVHAERRVRIPCAWNARCRFSWSRQTQPDTRVQKGFTGGWVAVHGDGTPGSRLPLCYSSRQDKPGGRANYRSICKSNALTDRGKLGTPWQNILLWHDKGAVNDLGNRMRLVDLIWARECVGLKINSSEIIFSDLQHISNTLQTPGRLSV